MSENLKSNNNSKNNQVSDQHWEEDYLRGKTTLARVCHDVGIVTYRTRLYACVGVLEVVKSAGEALIWSALAGGALGATAVAGLVDKDGASCRTGRDASSLVKEIST